MERTNGCHALSTLGQDIGVDASEKESLVTKEFVALNAVFFINYCNVAVFFHLHAYLQTLPVPPGWSGFLIGVFALSAMVVRPFLGFRLHHGNVRAWILLGAALSATAFFSYNWATDLWGMALVRIVHGVGFGIIDAAAMVEFVGIVTPKRSGSAFDVLFVFLFLPFGVIPPLLKPLTIATGSFLHVTDLMGLLMLLFLPVVLSLKQRTASRGVSERHRIDKDLIFQDLRNRAVWVLLGACLMLYATWSMVFFFLEGHAHNVGLENAGWFFTLVVFTAIAVRLGVMPFVDKMSKPGLLAWSLGLLAIAYVMLAYVLSPFWLFAVAVLLGLARGLSVPLVAAILFDDFPADMRALNGLLNREVAQAGYFIGPTIGAPIILAWGYGTLFWTCAVLSVGVLALVPLLHRKDALPT